MKGLRIAAVLAFACAGAACSMNRAKEIRYEVPVAVDSLDSVMRYQVANVDARSKEVVLVPVRLASEEVELQAGHELRLTFGELQILSGRDAAGSDVGQSLATGREVLVYGKRMGIPNAIDDIARIEIPAAKSAPHK
jgi:hypothetical protein